MLQSPASCTPTLAAPTVHLDAARHRASISLTDGTLFGILPSLIERVRRLDGHIDGMEIVVDCRRCPTAPSFETIHALAAALVGGSHPHGPIAFLTTAPHVYGMGRVLELLVEAQGDEQVRVFDQEAHAELWMERWQDCRGRGDRDAGIPRPATNGRGPQVVCLDWHAAPEGVRLTTSPGQRQ